MDSPKFQSPFTWEIDDEFALNFDDSELETGEELPFYNFMHSIMATFIYATKGDYNAAKNNFSTMDDLWNLVDQGQLEGEQVSVDTVNHILQSTKYHVLLKLQDFMGEENISREELKRVEPSVSVTNISTLNGCKSIAWSIFHETGMEKAITFARLASLGNQRCSLWHFVLGKNLRRFRRETAFSTNPSQKEVNSFLKAYEIHRNPLYGIYLSQTYSENNQNERSKEVYMKVFREKPESIKIQLRLALCFLRAMDLPKAKLCLDYVEQYTSDSTMYLHYRGKYYKKLDDYERAALYLKEASKLGVFGADLEYGQCMSKIYPDFDQIVHLLYMEKRFRHNKVYLQNIYLHIGMESYDIKKYEKSLKYFALAVKLIPSSKILQRFYYKSIFKLYNIFDFVNGTLVPEYKSAVNNQDLPIQSVQYLEKINNIHAQKMLQPSNNTDENNEILLTDETNARSKVILFFFLSIVLIISWIVY
ncbi:uncharacterized protein LOC100679025 [Nasonia vitripennis]|uniref:Uncharacterized protein n=1 Tax=Nasonia vitripennis TaxID=7425 RepID=A0A7M7LVD5_NASVI|nr:uncharacterized protein LOC100679025 [Nasonia vitripennis]